MDTREKQRRQSIDFTRRSHLRESSLGNISSSPSTSYGTIGEEEDEFALDIEIPEITTTSNFKNRTDLHKACAYKLKIISDLLGPNPQIDALDEDGETPLHDIFDYEPPIEEYKKNHPKCTVFKEYKQLKKLVNTAYKILQILIKYAATKNIINKPNIFGLTPFLCALQTPNIDSIKILLNNENINACLDPKFLENIFSAPALATIKAFYTDNKILPLDFVFLRNQYPRGVYALIENMQDIFHTLLENGATSYHLAKALPENSFPAEDLNAVLQYNICSESKRLEFLKSLKEKPINFSLKNTKHILYLCVYRKYPNNKDLSIANQLEEYLKSEHTNNSLINRHLEMFIDYKAILSSNQFKDLKDLSQDTLKKYLPIAIASGSKHISKLEDFNDLKKLEEEHLLAKQELQEINLAAYKNRIELIKRLQAQKPQIQLQDNN